MVELKIFKIKKQIKQCQILTMHFKKIHKQTLKSYTHDISFYTLY